MTWAHELLGIAADADAATIKRAYARLLRTTRPDEDAEAFQRLNTAYRTALAQTNRRPAAPTVTPAPIAQPAHESSPVAAPKPTAPLTPRPNADALETLHAPEAGKPAHEQAPLETLKPNACAPKPANTSSIETLRPLETAKPAASPAPLEILKPNASATKPTDAASTETLLEILKPHSSEPKPAAPPPVETLRPATPPPAQRVNVAELSQRIIDEAGRNEDTQALTRWLNRCPELWSFRVKQAAGQWVLQGLMQAPKPVPGANFDALLHFFDFDHVLSGVQPTVVGQLRNRQTLYWEMLHDPSMAARRLRILTQRGQPDTARTRNCIRLLQQKRNWWQIALASMKRGQSLQLARMVQALCNGQFQQLPPMLDRGHAQFWFRAASGYTRERMMLGAVRAASVALGCALLIAIMLMLASLSGDAPSTANWQAAGIISPAMFGGILSGWAVLYTARWVDHWQGLPETTASSKPWWRRLFIPALCALALTLDYLIGIPVAAILIVLVAIVLSIRRYARRAAMRIRFPVIKSRPLALLCAYLLLGGVMPILGGIMDMTNKGVFDSSPMLAIASAFTLLVWGIDMWRHRAHWRPKRAAA